MDETLPPPPAPAPVRRRWLGGSKLFFESALIVASVALGFAVSEWRERVADRRLAKQVLHNVAAELEANAARLRAQIAEHDAQIGRLERALAGTLSGHAWDVITTTLQGGINALPMRRAAWDAATSTGALRVIDYEIASVLSEIYGFQEEGYGRIMQGVGNAFFTPDTFRQESSREVVTIFRWQLNDLRGNESYLLETLERHLPAVRKAAAE